MKEEQERPKIKLKVRQTEELPSSSFDEQNSKELPVQTEKNNPTQTIIIHESSNSESEENEKEAKKRTIFQICATVLTILLAIAIIVEIIVMICFKNNTDDLKNKNNKLPKEETSISIQI